MIYQPIKKVEAVFKLQSAGGIAGDVEWFCDNEQVDINVVNKTTVNANFNNLPSNSYVTLEAVRDDEIYKKLIQIIRDSEPADAKIIGDNIIIADEGITSYDFSLGLYNKLGTSSWAFPRRLRRSA